MDKGMLGHKVKERWCQQAKGGLPFNNKQYKCSKILNVFFIKGIYNTLYKFKKPLDSKTFAQFFKGFFFEWFSEAGV